MDKLSKLYASIDSYIVKKGAACAVGVILIFTAFLACMFVNTELVADKYSGSELMSNMVQGSEKLIENESDSQGIFTYGPYINLKKGKYAVTVYYKTDEDRLAECSADYGAMPLATDIVLPKDKESYTFDINVDKDITDKSVEVRTIYNGSGSFYVESISVQQADINYMGLVYIAVFIATAMLACYVFRHSERLRLGFLVYMGVIQLILYQSMSASILGIVSAAIMFVAVILGLNLRWSDIVSGIKDMDIVHNSVCAIICAYLCSAVINMGLIDSKINTIDFIRGVDMSQTVLVIVLIFNCLILARLLTLNKYIIYRATQIAVWVLAVSMLMHNERSIYFTAGVVTISGFFTFYMCKEDRLGLDNIRLNKYTAFAMVCIGFAIFSVLFGIETVARYSTFSASNFDFGIFAQMYENMARTGLPVTTVERNELMSHFYIHFSPIYYVLLPLYYIFRSPEYLLVMQSIIVGLGVFPLFLLCCKKSGNYLTAVIISYIYLCLPGLIGPMFYDFHENAFLPVMLMSLLYFFEVKNYRWMYIFAVLTLLIKEDAAIYVLSVALYNIFAKREYKHGCILFVVAGCYFGIVMAGISYFGKGLMDSHYGMYYLAGESGVGTMFKNMFTGPGLVVNTIFNEDTVEFILYTLGVLLFVPLFGKKLSYLWLLTPYLLINMVTSYAYQHDIGYQYTFGTVTLLMFLYAVNIYKFPRRGANILIMTTLLTCVCGVYTYKGNLNYFGKAYKESKQLYQQTDELLERLPEDVSITADTFVIPHLYKHTELYQYPYDKELTDYYVLQPLSSADYDSFTEELADMGYIKVAANNKVAVFKSPSAKAMKTN